MFKYFKIWLLLPLLLLGLACAEQPKNITSVDTKNKFQATGQNTAPNEPVKAEPITKNEETALDNTKDDEPEPQVVITPPHQIMALPVPFMVQAPHANWDMPYQEACEEASILMVQQYVAGRKDLLIPANEADELILALIAWEEQNSYPIDLNSNQIVKLLKERFNIEASVVEFNVALIKQEIQAKRPVIIPAAGRLLGNPYFRQPGPLYHMLVVKGYNSSTGEFIVNDPGTRHGESYFYKESVIAGAVHDWNEGDVTSGAKVMVLLK